MKKLSANIGYSICNAEPSDGTGALLFPVSRCQHASATYQAWSVYHRYSKRSKG